MEENKSSFTNNTTKLLYLKEQHFWSGTPLAAPGRLPPGSTTHGKQKATAAGALKFATVYVDNEETLPTTRQFVTAFDISAPQEFGPYGSQSPKNYSLILGPDERIVEVIVRHGFVVDAIGFVVADKTGATSTTIFGGDGGYDQTKIALKSYEFITQISGTHGKYLQSNSDSNVATLTIHTNLNPAGYGPYGRGELVQNSHDFISKNGPVIGFFGRHDGYLQSVGVYLSTNAASKAYAHTSLDGPIDWNVVEVKLGLSEPSAEYDDSIFGGMVLATVYGNGEAGVNYQGPVPPPRLPAQLDGPVF